jgi:hypothetical protein
VQGSPNGHTMIVIVQNPCELMMGAEPIQSCQLSTPSPATQTSKTPQQSDGCKVPSGFGKAIEERLRATFGCRGANPSDFPRRRDPLQGYGSAFEKAEPGTVLGQEKDGVESGLQRECLESDYAVDAARQGVSGFQRGGFERNAHNFGGTESPEKRRHGREFRK